LSIEIGDRVFEHRSMGGRTRSLEIAERASARKLQRVAPCPLFRILPGSDRHCRSGGSRSFLLRFDRFTFPSSSHRHRQERVRYFV